MKGPAAMDQTPTDESIVLTCFSDVLCVWAHLSEARLDEVRRCYGSRVHIDYRFFPVFGNSARKIGTGWRERGGYAGFADHVREAMAPHQHIELHPAIWRDVRPASSAPAHLMLKAVQRVAPHQSQALLVAVRKAYFRDCRDIARRSVLEELLQDQGVDVEAVRDVLDSGEAHADLEADEQDRREQQVQGSPTLVLNNGRQKLFGNVGFRLIDANIEELLRTPRADAASWC